MLRWDIIYAKEETAQRNASLFVHLECMMCPSVLEVSS